MRVAGRLTSHFNVNEDDVAITMVGGGGGEGDAGDVMHVVKALNPLDPATFCACIDKPST